MSISDFEIRRNIKVTFTETLVERKVKCQRSAESQIIR